MKKINNKILIPTIILICVIFLGLIGYSSYSKNKSISEFTAYIESYKEESKNYIFNDNREVYESLLKESEEAILDKDYKKTQELEVKLNKLKEDLVKTNFDLVNKNIAELKAIDISKLDDKESIVPRIDNIKKLGDEQKFINSNEEFIALKNEITLKLEVIKVKEEQALEAEENDLEEDIVYEEPTEIEEEKVEEETVIQEISKEEAVALVSSNTDKTTDWNEFACENASEHKFFSRVVEDYNLPNEDFYVVYPVNIGVGHHYIVGKESGNVYYMGNQGGAPAKLIKDGVEIQIYEYVGPQ